MKIGVCTGIENIGKLEKMGFDYLEAGVNSIVPLEKEKFLNLKKLVDDSSIKCEAMNCFFPWDIKLTGPDASDIETIRDYTRKAAERAAALGTRVFIVGNGGARRVPDGWDREKAAEQFANAIRITAEEALRHGITVAVEPLNKGETNFINSVKESLDFVKIVNHSNVKQMADFFHMRRESESMDGIIEAGSNLVHMHIANSNGRIYPRAADEDEYGSLFDTLRSIGYNARISIEGSAKDFEVEAPAALKVLRELSK